MLRRLAQRLGPLRQDDGLENFDFPGTAELLSLSPQRPDLVHCHNLHGGYFDLRYLPKLSRTVPTFLTLHDAWLLSGHCAHSFACERWRTGCGHCPDLSIPPAMPADRTAENWARKAKIYRRSRLLVAAPSKWLMSKIEGSMLLPGIVESRVIPNGIDLRVFDAREDRGAARQALGIKPDAFVLVFAANGIRENVWKDIDTLRTALGVASNRLGGAAPKLHLLALGENAPAERLGSAMVEFVSYVSDPLSLARYYRAADLYVHAARADTFPNTVLEALACGTPVVATAVGGIPEQVRSLSLPGADAGVGHYDETTATGVLTPAADGESMAAAIEHLARNEVLLASLRKNARRDAERRFDLDRQVDEYIEWYRAQLER
jgi:glycosyltransferase involved in cell wall biosynthesis